MCNASNGWGERSSDAVASSVNVGLTPKRSETKRIQHNRVEHFYYALYYDFHMPRRQAARFRNFRIANPRAHFTINKGNKYLTF